MDEKYKIELNTVMDFLMVISIPYDISPFDCSSVSRAVVIISVPNMFLVQYFMIVHIPERKLSIHAYKQI